MAKAPSPENKVLAREASKQLHEQALVQAYTVSKRPPLAETLGITRLAREIEDEQKRREYNRRLHGENDDENS